MKKLADERQARLTFLKRELLKSLVGSKFYYPKLNCYAPPARVIPKRVKRLLNEIKSLEDELNGESKVQ